MLQILRSTIQPVHTGITTVCVVAHMQAQFVRAVRI